MPRCAPLFRALRLLALAATLCVGAAHADEYGDVRQLLRTGKLSEAKVVVDRYLASKPRDPQMRFFKGVIQRDSGQLADAMTTFTRLTEDHPELPEPYNNLAVIHASLGQNDKARATLERAIRTNPSYATAHENLGDVYAQLASQAYNKALQIDNASATAQPKLALIRELFIPAGGGQPDAAAVMAASPARVAAAPSTPGVTAPPLKPTAPAPTTAAATKPADTSTAAPVRAPVAAVASPKVAVPPPGVPASDPVTAVEDAVRTWAKAWADQNMAGYLRAYAPTFTPPGNLSRSAWEQERHQRIAGKARISVGVLNLRVTINGNRAVAKFQQDYKSGTLVVLSRKTLELVKTGDRWMIVKETSGA